MKHDNLKIYWITKHVHARDIIEALKKEKTAEIDEIKAEKDPEEPNEMGFK